MYLSKNIGSILLVVTVVFSAALISCAQDEGHKNHNMDMQESNQKKVDTSIVREGEIELIAIDANGDGMLFQDPMDWNVIADEAGRCPLCNMALKEVTLEKAEENLINNGFKVKGNR